MVSKRRKPVRRCFARAYKVTVGARHRVRNLSFEHCEARILMAADLRTPIGTDEGYLAYMTYVNDGGAPRYGHERSNEIRCQERFLMILGRPRAWGVVSRSGVVTTRRNTMPPFQGSGTCLCAFLVPGVRCASPLATKYRRYVAPEGGWGVGGTVRRAPEPTCPRERGHATLRSVAGSGLRRAQPSGDPRQTALVRQSLT
jgi:hypothetical protein